MTLKQQKLLKEIPRSKTLMEAGIKAGYSRKTGNIYRGDIKEHIAEAIGYDPKAIVRHYEELLRLARHDHNLELEKSICDSLSRINAMFTDRIKQENTNKYEVSSTLDRFKDLTNKPLSQV